MPQSPDIEQPNSQEYKIYHNLFVAAEALCLATFLIEFFTLSPGDFKLPTLAYPLIQGLIFAAVDNRIQAGIAKRKEEELLHYEVL